MPVEQSNSAGFRLWTARESNVQIRRNEIRARVSWAISVRWIFVLIGIAGILFLEFDLLPVDLDVQLLVLSTGLLAGSNGLFHILLSQSRGGRLTARDFLVAQAVMDFGALTVISYALGSIETPIALLYLPHVVLLTLLLEWKISLSVTFVAATLASLPLLLTHLGVLPVVSIFGSNLAEHVAASRALTLGFSMGVLGCYLTTWYLVSQVSNGLVMREKRLEQDCARLTETARNKTMATLRATHELKAPLAAIKSYVYTMRDGYTGELPSKAVRVVQRIGDRCDLLTQRITDIIHLANLQTLDRGELKFGPTNLYAVLRQEATEAGQRGRLRTVRVLMSPQGPGPMTISGSDGELRSMLANLLDNAVEYSHLAGEVKVSLTSTDDEILLQINDEGIGIPSANLAKIFQDHFRSDNAVTHKPNGSGLGMAIVREIARLHEAEVDVTSKLGRGTEVAVTFPHQNESLGGG